MYEMITQGIGLIASAVIIFSFTQKADNRLKVFLIIGNLIFILHFFMLGAFAGMLVNMINALRVGFSIKFYKSTKMMLFFMLAYITACGITYQNIYDILPVISGVLGSFSMFKLSGISMRLTGLIGSSAWLSYAIVFHSIGGIITEVSVLILNTLTILRLRGDKTNDKNT